MTYGDTFDIAQSDVHTANETHTPVDDNELAVVAIVDLRSKRGKTHRQEGHHFNTFLAHPLEETVADIPTAHIVNDHPDLNALAGPCNEGITDKVSQGIVLEDIHVDVDMVSGTSYLPEQGGKELVSVSIDLNATQAEGQREVLVDEKVDNGFVNLRQLKVLLLDELQHGPLRQLVERTLADKTFLAGVNAKEQVKHHANDGYEPDDQCPGHGLCRLPVVHHHMDNRQHRYHLVKDYQSYAQSVQNS